MNGLTTYVYQFIKAYYLFRYEHNLPLPTINRGFIELVFTIVAERTTHGRQSNRIQIIFDQLDKFFQVYFVPRMHAPPISKANLNQIIGYASISILTCIKNNIWMHFNKRVNKFVNAVFYRVNQETINRFQTNDEREAYKAELRAIMRMVKHDLLYQEDTPGNPHTAWVQQHRPYLIPNIARSVPYDLKADPIKFLPHMIWINNQLEQWKSNNLNVFPSEFPVFLNISISIL